MTSRISDNTCLLVAGSMLVAVAWHTGRKRTPTGVLPGKPTGALLAKLACESQGAGAGLHPRGAQAGQIGGNGSWGQGHARELGRVWGEREKVLCHKPMTMSNISNCHSRGSRCSKEPTFPWKCVNVGPSVLTNRLLVLVVVLVSPSLFHYRVWPSFTVWLHTHVHTKTHTLPPLMNSDETRPSWTLFCSRNLTVLSDWIDW